MLRIHQLKLPLSKTPDEVTLRRLCAAYLKLPENRIGEVKLQKRSVDARDKGDVHFALTVDAEILGGSEEKLAAKFKPNQVAIAKTQDESPDLFHLPAAPWGEKLRPIVVGAGPAGLFCALSLALRGAKPLLIERGKAVEDRALDVAAFEKDSTLDEESNVLFGEGGAGAFSDGKLTCGLNSPHIQTVLKTLHICGAPENILTAQKPHIGTDVLRQVLAEARRRLIGLGGQVRFSYRMTDVLLKDGKVRAIRVSSPQGQEELPVERLFLAIGHSARDTYRLLHSLGMPMEQKPFAIGARIEHRQEWIDRGQYGRIAGHPALPPAEYKLNVPTRDQRGVYTFCMCPGGQVISAIHEKNTVNVNGMSMHARDGVNANAALLVGVRPEDFGSDHPLAGVEFQRRIEEAAFRAVASYKAPCQRVEDLLNRRETTRLGEVSPSYLPGVTPGDLRCCLPEFVLENFRYALPKLGQRLRGFDHPDALLTGPETRSSAPLRMLRGKDRQSPIGGIYPLGEGAGYAGGIVSAAVDGLCAGLEA
ncbi:MAG: NAD(P)/FAD-dependent oxidoreductase [Clostridia bacterium]|nr:NAD(P)/FAD-dependent oxidoreductase [Clostridia bacterium]